MKRKSMRSLLFTLALVMVSAIAWGQENPLASYSVEELWHMRSQLAPFTVHRIEKPFRGTDPERTLVPDDMAYLHQTRYGPTIRIPKPGIRIDEDAELKIMILNEILARETEPHWSWLAHWELGLTYFALRQFEKGISHFEAARSDSEAIQGKYLGDLARAYEYIGALDQAEDALRLELERADDPALRFQLAMLLEKQNRFEEALEVYDEVLRNEELYPSTRSLIYQRIDRVLHGLKFGKSLGRIKGTVTLNGEGIGGVQVFITVDSNTISSYPNVVETTFTRENGEFELYGVPEGRYRLGIFVPFHLAEGSSVQFVPSQINLSAGGEAKAAVRLERRSAIGQSSP